MVMMAIAIPIPPSFHHQHDHHFTIIMTIIPPSS
jgi:hypothetical protein